MEDIGIDWWSISLTCIEKISFMNMLDILRIKKKTEDLIVDKIKFTFSTIVLTLEQNTTLKRK